MGVFTGNMFPVKAAPERDTFPHGGIVRARRIAVGLTQAEVARRAGLSEKRYQDIEKGLNTSIRLLRQVADALGCDLEELTGRESRRPLTPYDTNPDYRDLIANLEAIDQSDREAILRIVEKLAAAVGQTHTPRREKGPANPGPLTLPSSQPYNDHAGYLMPSRQRKRAAREPTGEPKTKV
jgi:transcriptional regulator with XRE-family HTH domain